MPIDGEPVTTEDAMPCAFGLLVGTLALMTAHALPEAAPHLAATTQQRLAARKIVSNLYLLQQHADAPPPLRQVAVTLYARWLPLAEASDQTLPVDTAVAGSAGTRWH